MTRKVFLALLLFFTAKVITAQVIDPNVYHVYIDLLNVAPDKDRVKVTIQPPAITATYIEYILPEYLPGVPGKVDAGRFIHQFYALDDKNFPLSAKKKGNNTIVLKMRKGSTLKKIEYWIDDTWDVEKSSPKMSDARFNYVQQSAGTNIDAGNDFVINHAFVFGYIKGFDHIPYKVSVLKPDYMTGTSALTITHESFSRDNYSAGSYEELVDNPVMYARPDTVGFLSGNTWISISVFSENEKISAHLVRRLIAAQIMASTNFLSNAKGGRYQLIFYFTTPLRTVLNMNGVYGGLAHARCAFYFLPELTDEEELSDELLRVTSGCVLHSLCPLDYRSTCGTNDFLQPQLSSAWWFCEGTNLYFSWVASVRDSFVSEEEFMGFVSAKIRLATFAPQKPLTDVKMLNKMLDDPFKREAIRAKAFLAAFLLDISIAEKSGGKKTLRDVVMQLNDSACVPRDSIMKNIIHFTTGDVGMFFSDYVNGEKPLPLISTLGEIGWTYAPSTLDSVQTFGRFGMVYNEQLDAFFIHNADTTNAFHLHDGDRLLSINGKLLTAASFDQLIPAIYQPKKGEEVNLRFVRLKENMEVTAVPHVILVSVEHLIRRDRAADDKAKMLHDKIFMESELKISGG